MAHRSRRRRAVKLRIRLGKLAAVRRFSVLVLIGIGALVACSDPPPKTPKQGDQVPANSLDDDRLHGKDTKQPGPSDDDNQADPTQPLMTQVGDNSDGAPAPAASGSKPAPGGKGAVSKAECDKAFDKYLSLEIGSNPALKGATPDMIAQAKQMAKQQKGDEPCTATRAQYNCAMAATTTAAWQKCMK